MYFKVGLWGLCVVLVYIGFLLCLMKFVGLEVDVVVKDLCFNFYCVFGVCEDGGKVDD